MSNRIIAIVIAVLAVVLVLALAIYDFDKYLDERVYDFDSCVRITGISTDGVPSECYYNGRNYIEKINNINMIPDLDSCLSKGGVIDEQIIYCVTAPCNPIRTCTLKGKIYVEQYISVNSYKSGCDSVNGTFTEVPMGCVDSNGVNYNFLLN